MKKIVIASLSVVAASSAFAAGGALTGGQANAVAAGTGGCDLLQTAVTINVSTANVGYYDCNTSSSSIGVAVGNTSGKNKVFSAGSSGGGITETTLSAAPTTSDAQTAAQGKSASS